MKLSFLSLYTVSRKFVAYLYLTVDIYDFYSSRSLVCFYLPYALFIFIILCSRQQVLIVWLLERTSSSLVVLRELSDVSVLQPSSLLPLYPGHITLVWMWLKDSPSGL